jgi:hypothetical protein
LLGLQRKQPDVPDAGDPANGDDDDLEL